MDPFLLGIFQTHVRAQCLYVINGYIALVAALQGQDKDRAWEAIQQIVVSAANVSKLLWGQRGSRAADRKDLRDSLGVLDKSPMRSPDMRNHFEHIDERIDRWWADSPNHLMADANIGPYPITRSFATNETFRHLDSTTGSLWFWGESYDLPAIVKEAQRIYAHQPLA